MAFGKLVEFAEKYGREQSRWRSGCPQQFTRFRICERRSRLFVENPTPQTVSHFG